MEPYCRLLALVALAGVLSVAQGTTLIVCPSCELTSIRRAIALASEGSLIRVQAGTYRESEIVVNKRLTIVGEGWPVVDGGGSGNVINITANRVRIQGLEIHDSGRSYIEDLAGIKVAEANDCELIGNRLFDNFFGIHIGASTGCVVEGNLVRGPGGSENTSGNGIHLWNAGNVKLSGNQVSGHRDGIYFEFVKDSLIERNRSVDNLRYGLHFMYSNHDEYRDNEFFRNCSGVAVMYSRNILMRRNRFLRSWGSAAYGILLKEISASRIEKNLFDANTVGAYLEGTTRSMLEGNTFRANGRALRILGDSDGNLVWHNEFFSNTFDVSTNASVSGNIFTENYWSQYSGLDLNHDGIGDSPYHPVQLSSLLMERFGSSVVLLKSFFFAVADEAERLLPALTPVNLRDDRPLMRPWEPEKGALHS